MMVEATGRMHRGRAIRRIGLGAAVLAVLWSGALALPEVIPGGLPLEPGALGERIQSVGAWGPAVLMALMVLAVVVGPIPTFPISATAGLAYGPWLGSAYAVAGATAGALIAFAIARLAGRPVVARLVGGHVAFCPGCSDRLLFWVVLVARLVPVVSFAVVSYGAGLTAMTARAFTVATAVGMLPMTAVYVTLGASLALDPAWFAVAGVAAVVLMLGGPRWLERHGPERVRRMLAHAR